jgi:hypothetical protein
MLIRQISAQDTITQQVVAAMISRSTVLEFAEFYKMVGNADLRKKEATATGGQFRGVNDNYGNNIAEPSYATINLKIFGDQVQVDRAYERRGWDIPSERARQLIAFAKNLGKNFQKYFFDGDSASDAKQWDGLKKLIPNDQVITAAANGFEVVLGNSDTAKKAQQQFLELMNELITKVDGGAQVLFMNNSVLSRLTTIAREFIQYNVNEFGQQIAYYNGIPVRTAGYDASGADILGLNETQGTANDCTSIYAVRFGEASDLTIATNVGVEVKDLGLVGNFYVHSVEFDACPVVLNNKAVARLKGIRL